MTKKSKTIGSDTWTWEETPETAAALKQLHKSVVENRVTKPNAPKQ
ncbi:hypothetical protein Syn7803C97_27 [Synechococcus phage S-MbCM6]|jgi:hypothetical protein|uniref:Uncharacterized protein n=3 Tax=Namakavirus smbcm6 TaxID=2734120 RepID=H8ZMD2_9CAUD|nr:hypothetical protein [Synechococcus phage ACG-2014c]AHB80661.1 hypothetical protein S-MbCM25_026 [Synechococcus phage S-MbCM25]AFD02643.1 hypothetical protein [Synechococcus phage ACG-2014c]AIX14420.1 hypothetical protein Syn7803C43_25 [Synechococcus phage ACG-2014c]AIX22580.1 hypothetical protein Syn7803C97_27 [Synechococcus phage ACG-2014c]AIX22794.1 hypothetical protein Syn7803C98_26 [Synechococcus phage ACG-2014c]